jgi:hypothetical protein
MCIRSTGKQLSDSWYGPTAFEGLDVHGRSRHPLTSCRLFLRDGQPQKHSVAPLKSHFRYVASRPAAQGKQVLHRPSEPAGFIVKFPTWAKVGEVKLMEWSAAFTDSEMGL